MIPRPSRRLLLILLVGAIPAALASRSPAFVVVMLIVDIVAFALFAIDAWVLGRDESTVVRRSIPARVSRHTPFVSILEVLGGTRRSAPIRIVDRLPESFEPRERRLVVELDAKQHVEQQTSVVATRRGAFEVRAPIAERATPLGLGIARVRTEGAIKVAVLPDTRSLGQFDTLVRQRRLNEMGVTRVRDRGEGTEFAGLRPYALGDPFARIDWKATARRGTPISREMHAERRQSIVLLLDCGRRMAREADGRSRLDHAVEAALLLSHVALRSDDRVGLVAFADRILRVVPPIRSPASARVLAEALFSLEPTLREPAYETVAANVSRHFSKRSFIVFFTDSIEPSSLATLAKPVRFLSQRHLVLCVVFEDASIKQALRDTPQDGPSFFLAGAAAELAVERENGLRQLRNAGALLLESPAGKLSTEVINRYLEVKARRLL